MRHFNFFMVYIGQREAAATKHVVHFLNAAAKLTGSFPQRAEDKSLKMLNT